MDNLKISHYRIRGKDSAGRPREPFSLAVLADLHNCEIGPSNRELLAAIGKHSPQAVLLAGDMLTAKFGRVHMERSLALMGELTSRYPVFSVNGNHEERLTDEDRYGSAWEKYRSRAESIGVQILRSRGVELRAKGMRLSLYGYEMTPEEYKHPSELTPEDLERALGPAPEDSFSILLIHHPDSFAACVGWGADLTLCGHKHGGMIRLPGAGGLLGPGLQLFPRYTRGMYLENERRMIVSAGLGSHTIPLRINNPPELVIVDIL